MTQYQKAFDDVQKEISEQELKQIKEWMRSLLTKIEEKKKEKEKVEEELRVLKMDLEDLRQGKLDRIKERQQKSEVAKNVSPIVIWKVGVNDSWKQWQDLSTNNWTTYTSGTYNVKLADGSKTVFYF